MAYADSEVNIVVRSDISKAEKELARYKKKIEEIENSLSNNRDRKSSLEQQLQATMPLLDAAKAKLVEMQRAGVKGIDMSSQREEVRLLQAEFNKISNEIDRLNEKIANGDMQLGKMKETAGGLQEKIDKAKSPSEELKRRFGEGGEAVAKFGKRIVDMAKSIFVFALIRKGLQEISSYMSKALASNTEFQAALARLKGALLTAFQPIYNLIVPALITLMNVITRVIMAIANLFAIFGGGSAKQNAADAKALNAKADAIGGVGGAAKKAEKQLASFDEINQLQDTSSGGGGGGGSGSTIDFSGAEQMQGSLNNILGTVAAIAAGLAAWKIASIFTEDLKKIAGVTIAVAGTVKFAFEWFDAMSNGINLDNLIGMVGSLAVAAGGMALAFGSVAAGWTLIIGGAAILVAAIKDIAENGVNLYNVLGLVAGLFGLGLGIGILTGNWLPLLIVGIAGAIAIFVTALGHGEQLALGLQTAFGGFIDFFKGIFTQDFDLAAQGIGKILEGIGLIFDSVILSIKDVVSGFLTWIEEKADDSIKPFIENIRLLWENLVLSVEEILGGLIQFLTGVFTGDWDKAWDGIKGIFKGIWNGIVSLLEGAVNFIINGVNALIKGLNKMLNFKLPDWLGGAQIGISIPEITKVSLPRLAQGAVIPPNREFLAVLGDQRSGTNIEAPLDTIVQAFRLAMNDMNGMQSEAVLYIGEQEMGKLIYRLNNQETRRIGVSLTGV